MKLCVRRVRFRCVWWNPTWYKNSYRGPQVPGQHPCGKLFGKEKRTRAHSICTTVLGALKAFSVATLTLEMTSWDLANRKRGCHHFQAIVRDREISVPEFIELDRYSFSFLLHNSALPSWIYISHRVHLRCSNFGVQQDNGIYPRPRNCFQNVRALRSKETNSPSYNLFLFFFFFFCHSMSHGRSQWHNLRSNLCPLHWKQRLDLRAARES